MCTPLIYGLRFFFLFSFIRNKSTWTEINCSSIDLTVSFDLRVILFCVIRTELSLLSFKVLGKNDVYDRFMLVYIGNLTINVPRIFSNIET